MEQRILEFINRRFAADCDWTNGNCYWFAIILKTRFPELNIYYLSKKGHFIVGYLGNYFDWTGKVELDEFPILFSEIEHFDPLWYEHLVRDCFL